MEVLRVFNNNVVLARSGGSEVILTGRGLGYHAKPGDPIDPSRVSRTFVPEDGRDPDHMGQLVSEIPEGVLELVEGSAAAVGMDRIGRDAALTVALADHITFAIERARTHKEVRYPLEAEVRNLYPEEYALAADFIAEINRRGSVELPRDEAVSVTLHLVNAGFNRGDLSYTYTMTGIIQQIVDVLEQALGVKLDMSTVNVGRFITHLRYLFVRINQHSQLASAGELSAVGRAVEEAYPKEFDIAQRVAELIGLRFGADLSPDEISYLTMHIVRVVGETERAHQ